MDEKAYKDSPFWKWMEEQHKLGTLKDIPPKYGNDIFGWWVQLTEIYAQSLLDGSMPTYKERR